VGIPERNDDTRRLFACQYEQEIKIPRRENFAARDF
jgi:hypothetical protein